MLKNNIFAVLLKADVAELVDALDLGSSAARCESSSLFIRTKIKQAFSLAFFVLAFEQIR